MYSLLIIDDEPPIADGLAEMLIAYDLPLKEIKVSYSSIEAMRLFEKKQFDIVLTDIRMPEIDGLEMFGLMRNISSDTKVIFLTGYADFEFAQKAIKLVAADFLVKPVEDDTVVDSINKAITQLDREFDRID